MRSERHRRSQLTIRMSNHYDAIIIGAGHNGLVTAAYLAKAGLQVLVLERRNIVGGIAVTEELFPGFRFNTCAQGVDWLTPIIVSDLDLARHGLEMLWADSTAFTPLPDGRYLRLWRDVRKTAEEISRLSTADAEKWPAFCRQVAQMTRFLRQAYMMPPPQVTSDDLTALMPAAKLGLSLRRLGGDDMVELLRTLPMSVAEFLDDWFETSVLQGTLGASGVTNIMQGPQSAGTAFVFLHHHIGSDQGVFRSPGLVRGGIGNLTEALAASVRQHGAEIRTEAEVAQVNIANGRVAGVTLANGEEITARRVISSADPKRTFLGLVDPLHLEPRFLRKVQNIKFRGASARVHLALDILPDFTARPDDGALRGVLSISPDLDYLERAYDDAKYGRISANPYLEVVIPSLSDPSLAPAGKHVMSIAVQYAPYRLRDRAWDDAQREVLGNHVVDTLTKYAPNIKDIILHRQVLTPLDLEQKFGLTEGNLNHGEMMLDQLLFMRPVPGWSNYRTPIESLYLCGAGAHPGGGVTGAPGYNAARVVLKDVGRMWS